MARFSAVNKVEFHLENGLNMHATGVVQPVNAPATAVGTGADTTEDTLLTTTIPANTLMENGKSCGIRAWGTTGANANTKTVTIYFGTQALATLTGTPNNVPWNVDIDVVRTAKGAQIFNVRGQFNNVAVSNIVDVVGSLTQDETAAIVVKVTGTNGVAVANDVTANALLVRVR